VMHERLDMREVRRVVIRTQLSQLGQGWETTKDVTMSSARSFPV
jgi:hypothetical protein